MAIRIIALMLMIISATALGAERKEFYQFPDATAIPDNARFLMRDVNTGQTYNPTGALIKSVLQGPAGSPDTQADILSKLAISADGTTLILTQGPTEAANIQKIEIRLRNGTVVTRLNADGTASFAGGAVKILGGVWQ